MTSAFLCCSDATQRQLFAISIWHSDSQKEVLAVDCSLADNGDSFVYWTQNLASGSNCAGPITLRHSSGIMSLATPKTMLESFLDFLFLICPRALMADYLATVIVCYQSIRRDKC